MWLGINSCFLVFLFERCIIDGEGGNDMSEQMKVQLELLERIADALEKSNEIYASTEERAKEKCSHDEGFINEVRAFNEG